MLNSSGSIVKEPFYREGLRFKCTKCSNCCRNDPGYVFLTKTDLKRLAERFACDDNEFIERYCRETSIGGFTRISLHEKPNYDCIYWEDTGCTVYEDRPLQCRSYPFWAPILLSRETWENEAKSCPGIGRGRLFSMKKIDRWIEARRIEPLLP